MQRRFGCMQRIDCMYSVDGLLLAAGLFNGGRGEGIITHIQAPKPTNQGRVQEKRKSQRKEIPALKLDVKKK